MWVPLARFGWAPTFSEPPWLLREKDRKSPQQRSHSEPSPRASAPAHLVCYLFLTVGATHPIAISHSSTNLELCDAGGLTRLTASLLRGRGRGLSWEEGYRDRLWIHQEGASFHRFIRILPSRLLFLRLSAFFDTCRATRFAIFPSNRHALCPSFLLSRPIAPNNS